MGDSYNLRSVLGGALPAVGPTAATVKAMHDSGYNADPKNSDMKELFVGLNLDERGSSPVGAADTGASATSRDGADAGSWGRGMAGVALSKEGAIGSEHQMDTTGPSAAQALLDYRREKKAAQEAIEQEAARLVAAGKGKGKGVPAIGGVGLERAVAMASADIEESAEDERHLRKVNLSKTAARMTSKQKRRQKQGKAHGTEYEEKYAGKVVNKARRKNRMLAMKQMY